MSKTTRYAVAEITRSHPIATVSRADFQLEGGVEIEPEEILRDPKYTLYCFDVESGEALFVESRDPLAVDRSAFYYQGQAENAVGVAVMPLETFHRMAGEIPSPPKGLIFVHSVGRCGSTLLSKVLEAIPAVHSLSEPDDLTQLISLRTLGLASDTDIQALIDSSVKWRCKARSGVPADWVAIKTRSEVLVLADLVANCLPNAKHFFLYRDGIAWMRTIFRNTPPERPVYDEALNRQMETGWSRTLPLIAEYRRDESPMNAIQIRILGWITCMEGYLKLRATGVPLAAARFEDLLANPIPILDEFFTFCGIEEVDREVLEDVLSRDSQAGTIYDREERQKKNRELTPELVQDVRDMIATRPLLGTPDVVLPGTMGH